MKKLVFITGTRADFGKIKILIKTMQDSDKFDTHVFATGMHMLKKYGLTINEVYKSGIENIFPFLNQDDACGSQMDYILANRVFISCYCGCIKQYPSITHRRWGVVWNY